MNLEERLAAGLHAEFDDAQPSPDLTTRIVERIAVRERGRVRLQPRRRIAGLVGLAAVVVLIPILWSLRPVAGPATSSAASEAPQSTPIGSASAEALAHFDRDGLAFDYPATWAVGRPERPLALGLLDYLGTGSVTARCPTPVPSAVNLGFGPMCEGSVQADPGEVVVTLSRLPAPICAPADDRFPLGVDQGQRRVTVGGLPATYQESLSTDRLTLSLTWMLSLPSALVGCYEIQATIQGPGRNGMQAQVDALMASIRYDPPVPVLDPADAARIAAIGLEKARAYDPALACFPSVPGATATATVTLLPTYAALRKPLPVTCSIAIEPNVIGLWKMTLTESWSLAEDRAAGRLVTTIWLAPDGTPGPVEGASVDVPVIPYLP